MQYMLGNGPYRLHEQDSRRRGLVWRLAFIYQLFLKLLLIACVALVFFQGIALILTIADGIFMEIAALAIWACGAIPLCYVLWRLNLSISNSR